MVSQECQLYFAHLLCRLGVKANHSNIIGALSSNFDSTHFIHIAASLLSRSQASLSDRRTYAQGQFLFYAVEMPLRPDHDA